MVFVYAFFPIAASAAAGFRGAPQGLVEMAHAFGASPARLVLRVLVPAARPLVGAGLRVGAGRAVKGMVNGEMFIAVSGLGAMVRTYGSRFDAERLLAVLCVLVAVAIVCGAALRAVERRVPGAGSDRQEALGEPVA